MLTSVLAVIAALAAVQATLVVKLADLMTEGAGRHAVGTEASRAGIA